MPKKSKETTEYDVWRDMVRKAKREHIVLIAYFFELTIVVATSIYWIQNLSKVSLIYGIIFSVGYLGAIFVPGALIWKLISVKGGL